MLRSVVEIIGPRQSGRTTKLREFWFNDLTRGGSKTFAFFGTDIRAKETINHVWNENHFTNIYIISPLGDLVKHYNRHKVTTYPLEEGIKKLISEIDVHLFIDNISLNRTEELTRDVGPYLDVKELYYTGLTFHSGRNRKIIKEVFEIDDLGELDFTSIKLEKERVNENV